MGMRNVVSLHACLALVWTASAQACGSKSDAAQTTAATGTPSGSSAASGASPASSGGTGATLITSHAGTTAGLEPHAGQGGAGASATAGQSGSVGSGAAGGTAGASPPSAGAAADGGATGSAGAAGETAAAVACDPADKQPDASPVTNAEQGMPPTGPYPVIIETDPTLKDFTIYRPMDLSKRDTFPVVAWENGGCSLDALLFAEFLKELSSYGIVIIVDGVPNGNGMGMLGVDGKTLLQAMDWATKENDRPCSKYYRKLEPNNVAAMGQSCGGLHAYAVAKDPRVSTVVIWNSGLLNADQTVLDSFHAPMAYLIGGMDDVSYPNADRDFKAITKPIPIFYGNLSVGHLATYSEDNGGEFGRVGAAWLRWQLLHDESADAKGMFVGADCGLCKTMWVIEKKNMD
jgi:hypothetical protein